MSNAKLIQESRDSLLSVTRDRPNPAITGILVNSKDSELADFLRFDPEKTLNGADTRVGFVAEAIAQNKNIEVDAQLMEVDRTGRYIVRHYKNKHDFLGRLTTAPCIEATPYRPITLREAMGFATQKKRLKESGLGWENESDSHNPFDTFTPLFMGPFYRQQYMFRMLEAKSKAYAAYTTNPVAKRIVNIITQFVLSKGVVATFEDPQAQQLWDEFAKFNKLGTSRGANARAGTKLRMWSDMLSVDGELMFKFTDKNTALKVEALDTATILEVVTDPEDINQVYYYHQQYATPYNVYSAPGVPGTRHIIRQIPAQDVLHVKINVFENEKRGRSDLYTIIGWLKRLKDLINANVIKAYFHACYTWDYKIKGNPTDVQNFAGKQTSKVPVPGSSYVHNENVERQLISPTGVSGAGVDNDMMGLLNMIALGSGVSLAYLASSFAGSRAGALTETEPSSKLFYDRQSTWDEILHEFADRLFDWAESKGIRVENRNVEFSFPQINPMERVALANLLTTAKTNKWFTDERCATLLAKEMAITSYDYRQERTNALTEVKEEIDRELEENKYRSLAETKLQVWQTYFSNLGVEEEQNIGGAGPNAGAAAGGAAASSPSQTTGGSDGAISGGTSEGQRASLARGGR